VGHTGTGVTQQLADVPEFTQTSVLDLDTQFLTRFRVTVRTDCVARLCEVKKQGFLDVKEHSHLYFTGGCLRFEFLQLASRGVYPLYAWWFSCGLKMTSPRPTARHDTLTIHRPLALFQRIHPLEHHLYAAL
jgi:hypothetical protein